MLNVEEVADYIKKAKENGKPYVLFTGAGCSKSANITRLKMVIQNHL